jgi:hypothetical protein
VKSCTAVLALIKAAKSSKLILLIRVKPFLLISKISIQLAFSESETAAKSRFACESSIKSVTTLVANGSLV